MRVGDRIYIQYKEDRLMYKFTRPTFSYLFYCKYIVSVKYCVLKIPSLRHNGTDVITLQTSGSAFRTSNNKIPYYRLRFTSRCLVLKITLQAIVRDWAHGAMETHVVVQWKHTGLETKRLSVKTQLRPKSFFASSVVYSPLGVTKSLFVRSNSNVTRSIQTVGK